MYWIGLALTAKRWHDLGHSGWFTLLFFVPLVGIFAAIYVAFFPGNAGQNKYGYPTGYFEGEPPGQCEHAWEPAPQGWYCPRCDRTRRSVSRPAA